MRGSGLVSELTHIGKRTFVGIPCWAAVDGSPWAAGNPPQAAWAAGMLPRWVCSTTAQRPEQTPLGLTTFSFSGKAHLKISPGLLGPRGDSAGDTLPNTRPPHSRLHVVLGLGAPLSPLSLPCGLQRERRPRGAAAGAGPHLFPPCVRHSRGLGVVIPGPPAARRRSAHPDLQGPPGTPPLPTGPPKPAPRPPRRQHPRPQPRPRLQHPGRSATVAAAGALRAAGRRRAPSTRGRGGREARLRP